MANQQLDLGNLTPDLNKSLGQWFTPEPLAARLVRFAKIRPHHRVLEPAAGAGAFIKAAKGRARSIDAHELDPRWAEYMRHRFDPNFARVHCGDYLEAPPPERPYDVSIMNPPYENNMEAHFLRKALGESERVFGLIRAHGMAGQERHEILWKDVDKGKVGMPRKINFITRPRFKGQGGMHEIVFVELSYAAAGCTTKESWWYA